jgi:hypothetical protein
MGAPSLKWLATQRATQRRPRAPLSAEERLALRRLRSEAQNNGARLRTAGRGGLSPSLVLSVMRRDDYTCKVHGDHGEGDFGGLELHHKGGVVESEWLSKRGHKNVPNNLVTVCRKAHDEIHNRARAKGVDSSQVVAEADVGTRHDHGQGEAP